VSGRVCHSCVTRKTRPRDCSAFLEVIKAQAQQLLFLERQYTSLQEFTEQLQCAFVRKCEALDAVIARLEGLHLQAPGFNGTDADAMNCPERLRSNSFSAHESGAQGSGLRLDLNLLMETDATPSDTSSETASSLGYSESGPPSGSSSMASLKPHLSSRQADHCSALTQLSHARLRLEKEKRQQDMQMEQAAFNKEKESMSAEVARLGQSLRKLQKEHALQREREANLKRELEKSQEALARSEQALQEAFYSMN